MSPTRDKTRVFGVDIDVSDLAGAVARIVGWCRTGQKGYVLTPNLDHVVRLRREARLHEIYAGARLVVADGMPLVWASRLGGPPLPERVAGADLVAPLASAAAAEGFSVFLLGSTLPVLTRTARRLFSECPGLRIAGVYAPPFGFDAESPDNEEIAAVLTSCGADIVFVALGFPKQERWAHRWIERLPVRAILCVGAALDFLAGEEPRAPRPLRQLGLEWLYRLIRHPWRLGPRYLTDLVFLAPLLWGQVRSSRQTR